MDQEDGYGSGLLAHRFEKRQTAAGEVAYKVGLTTDGEVVKEKSEFEDLRKHWDRVPEGGRAAQLKDAS